MKCYDQLYSSCTTSSNLDACLGSKFIFAGAKSSNSTSKFLIGAFGTSNVLAVTGSTTTAYYDQGGAYWYRYPTYSFGFAASSRVNLVIGDAYEGDDDCSHRLCWHVDNDFSGYRAGCLTWLFYDPTWRKVMYKGNIAPACFQSKCNVLHACSDTFCFACLRMLAIGSEIYNQN